MKPHPSSQHCRIEGGPTTIGSPLYRETQVSQTANVRFSSLAELYAHQFIVFSAASEILICPHAGNKVFRGDRKYG